MERALTFIGRIAAFAKDEDGAVTVDWVVGAAAGIMLALAITNAVSDGVTQHASNIGEYLSSREVGEI